MTDEAMKNNNPAENEMPEHEVDETTEETVEAKAEETAEEKELSKKDKKREEKQYKEENKQLTEKLTAATAELEKVKAELAETSDKYMRIAAEYDNFRKRSQREREATYTDAYADALKEILPIIDNLERAAQYSEAEKLAEGIGLIFKSASDMLGKLGIETFGEAGEKFDPNIHNAVMHVEDEEHGENEIIDVFQKGYRKGDRIIRHAMVRVAN